MKKLHALVLGASGATGQVLVKLLLEDSNFSKVSVFTRKTLTVEHQKLEKHIIDFSEFEKYKSLITGDILFSAFGTTRKDAGSKDQQYLIDYTYQLEFAKMALIEVLDKSQLYLSYSEIEDTKHKIDKSDIEINNSFYR